MYMEAEEGEKKKHKSEKEMFGCGACRVKGSTRVAETGPVLFFFGLALLFLGLALAVVFYFIVFFILFIFCLFQLHFWSGAARVQVWGAL